MIDSIVMSFALWLAGIVVGTLLILLVLAARKRVLLRMGLRNMLRRPSQSILIVFGLILSTVLTTASVGLGDSMSYSTKAQTVAQIGNRDERVTKIEAQADRIWPYFTASEAQQIKTRIQADPAVDSVIGAINTQGDTPGGTVNTQEFVQAYDTASKIINAENVVMAVPPDFDKVWGPLYSNTGQPVHFADLQPGEVYLGNVLAHFLSAQVGHRLLIFINRHQVEVTVRAILSTEVDPIDKYTMVMPLAYFQQVVKQPGAVNVLYIENKSQNNPNINQLLIQRLRNQFGNMAAAGQLKDFLKQLHLSAALEADFRTNVPPIDPSRKVLREFIDSLAKPEVTDTFMRSVQDEYVQSMLQRVLYKVDKSKLPELQQLEQAASPYHIEDFKQNALFLAQLTGAGTAVGLFAVSILLIGAGMLLIYLIFVMLVAERRSELGISRALGLQRSHVIQMFVFEGMAYTLISTLIGLPLGIGVTALLVRLVESLPPPPWGGGTGFVVQTHFGWPALVISFGLGLLMTLLIVTFSAYRVSRINIVAAIRDLEEQSLPEPSLRFLVKRIGTQFVLGYQLLLAGQPLRFLAQVTFAPLAATWRFLWSLFQRGLLTVPVGLMLLLSGVRAKDLFLYTIGVSLFILGIGLLIRWLLPLMGVRERRAERISFSVLGASLICYWALPVGSVEKFLGLYNRLDMPHFHYGYLLKGSVSSVSLVSAFLTVAGVIWLLLYNGNLLLTCLLFLTRRFGRPTAIIRTSLAYALNFKLRTGLIVAMFSLVTFVVVLLAMVSVEVSYNNQPTRDTGNWQLQTDSPNLPIDLAQQVMANPKLAQEIDKVGWGDNVLLKVRMVSAHKTTASMGGFVRAVNNTFLDSTQFHVQPRAVGFSSDRQVWDAVKNQEGLAVIYYDTSVEWGIGPDDTSFRPFDVQILDAQGSLRQVKVIGFLPVSTAWPMIFVSTNTGAKVFGTAIEPNWFVFRIKPGINENQVALDLTENFGAKYGMQPELTSVGTLKLSNFLTSVFNLLAGYLALGLVVGLCGLAVISRRVVVERQQQIGLLRALGYSRSQVQQTFLLESSFIALLGLLIGTAMGLWWAYQFTNLVFPAINANDHVFQVPILEIGLILLVSYLATLLATYLPARAAARIIPAVALRYE